MLQKKRVNVKFRVKLKNSDEVLFHARVFQWYKRFSEVRQSTEDNQLLGRPVSVSTAQTVIKINEIVHGNRRKCTGKLLSTS